VAPPHAELAEPTPDAGHVEGRVGQLVSVEGLAEVMDGLLLVSLPGVQDAEVLSSGGLGPRVGVLCGGLGQADWILAQKAQAVGRSGGDGGECGVVAGEGVGGACGAGGQVVVPRGQGGAHQPGRGGGFTEEERAVG